MKSLFRLLLSAVIAAPIAFGLFLFMRSLILPDPDTLGDGENEVIDLTLDFEIKDVQARNIRDANPDAAKKVTPPPPPPEIRKQKSSKPREGIETIAGSIPKIEAPNIGKDNFDFVISDRDARPLVIIPPQGVIIEEGGECLVRFDVDARGQPNNVTFPDGCRREFRRPSQRAVLKWKFEPKVQNGRTVKRRGVEYRFKFRLPDD